MGQSASILLRGVSCDGAMVGRGGVGAAANQPGGVCRKEAAVGDPFVHSAAIIKGVVVDEERTIHGAVLRAASTMGSVLGKGAVVGRAFACPAAILCKIVLEGAVVGCSSAQSAAVAAGAASPGHRRRASPLCEPRQHPIVEGCVS